MNNNSQHPANTDVSVSGMANDQIDSMATNPYHQQSQQYLDVDAKPATDYAEQPTINPQPMRPDEWIQGGTVLSDTTFSYGDYGVVERNNMSSNSTDQWEAQMRAAQYAATQGKTRYNTPVTQTPSVAPNIEEPPKPSEERLAQLRKRDSLVNLNNRLKVLIHDRQVASLKLASIDRGIKTIETELEELQ